MLQFLQVSVESQPSTPVKLLNLLFKFPYSEVSSYPLHFYILLRLAKPREQTGCILREASQSINILRRNKPYGRSKTYYHVP